MTDEQIEGATMAIEDSQPMGETVSIQPKRERWMKDELKPLRKLAAVAEAHELNVSIQCRKCGQFVQFQEGNGGLVLVCPCTTREVM